MIAIERVVQTCGACPAQWDAWTMEGDYLYVRYRYGHLRVSRGVSYRDDGETIYSETIGDALDGCLSYADLVHLTKAVIEWPADEAFA